MMALIAKWATYQGATLQPPHLVQWEDGTPATPEDYRKHIGDTHMWVIKSTTCIERRIFPDVVADVHYDACAGTWAITGKGVQPATLALRNPNATDDQIVEELYTFPVVYRVRIHR